MKQQHFFLHCKLLLKAIILSLLPYLLNADHRDTCISKTSVFPSVHQFDHSGTSVSDLTYLQKKESSDFYYRMRGLKLCSNADSILTGLQAYVAVYDTKDDSLKGTWQMNKIGSVTGRCSVLLLSPEKGEYVRKLGMRVGEKQIDSISISSNTGKVIFKGKWNGSIVERVQEFNQSMPLLAFQGIEDSNVLSLGFVTVDTECQIDLTQHGETGDQDAQSEVGEEVVIIFGHEMRKDYFIVLISICSFSLLFFICLIVLCCKWARLKQAQMQQEIVITSKSRSQAPKARTRPNIKLDFLEQITPRSKKQWYQSVAANLQTQNNSSALNSLAMSQKPAKKDIELSGWGAVGGVILSGVQEAEGCDASQDDCAIPTDEEDIDNDISGFTGISNNQTAIQNLQQQINNSNRTPDAISKKQESNGMSNLVSSNSHQQKLQNALRMIEEPTVNIEHISLDLISSDKNQMEQNKSKQVDLSNNLSIQKRDSNQKSQNNKDLKLSDHKSVNDSKLNPSQKSTQKIDIDQNNSQKISQPNNDFDNNWDRLDTPIADESIGAGLADHFKAKIENLNQVQLKNPDQLCEKIKGDNFQSRNQQMTSEGRIVGESGAVLRLIKDDQTVFSQMLSQNQQIPQNNHEDAQSQHPQNQDQ